MEERPGRNDLCSCGSGKKYKSCCMLKDQQKKGPLAGRKFTAKVLSAGGANAQHPENNESSQAKPAVDYALLMERSFGKSLHSYEEKPPIPSSPQQYLVQGESESSPRS